MPGVKSWSCHINSTHVQRLAGTWHKESTMHALLAVYRELIKFFQFMAPRFLVPGLNYEYIITNKMSGGWGIQVYELDCTSTRTVIELCKRLTTTETLLMLSCQLPYYLFQHHLDPENACKCWRLRSLTAKSKPPTSHVEHWSLSGWSNLPLSHRFEDVHPNGTCWSPQCSGPAFLEATGSKTTLKNHSTMVLLTSRIYFLYWEK